MSNYAVTPDETPTTISTSPPMKNKDKDEDPFTYIRGFTFAKDKEEQDQFYLPTQSIYGIACIGAAAMDLDELQAGAMGALSEFQDGAMDAVSGSLNQIKNLVDDDEEDEKENQNEKNKKPAENHGNSSIMDLWALSMNCYLMLGVNYALQIVILYHILELVLENLDDSEMLCGSDTYLRIACLTLFTAFMFDELLETLEMMQWHIAIPTEKKHKALRIKIHKTDTAVKPALSNGFTLAHKVSNFLFICIPKGLMGLFFLVVGGMYISVSGNNETIIMNTLALYFVLEIDEFIFMGFVSPKLKASMANLPPVSIPHQAGCMPSVTTCLTHFGSLLKLLLFIFVGNGIGFSVCGGLDKQVAVDVNGTAV